MNRFVLFGFFFFVTLQIGFAKGDTNTFSERKNIIRLKVENDILFLPNQTDHLYTNGTFLEWQSDLLKKGPFSIFLSEERFTSQGGLRIEQRIYTPTKEFQNLQTTPNRPFAGISIISYFQKATLKKVPLGLTPEIQLGVIGPYSGGGWTQNFIHSLTPYSGEIKGWESQISNGFLANLNLNVEYGIPILPWLNYVIWTKGQLGNINTNIQLGFQQKIGIIETNDLSPSQINPEKKITAFFLFETQIQKTVKEGSLSGGFNKLANNEDLFLLTNYQSYMKGSVVLRVKGIKVEGGLQYLSPLVVGNPKHGIGFIELSYIF